MKEELPQELINALEKELAIYQTSLLSVLKNYIELDGLDVSNLLKYGFSFEGSKAGTSFVDNLRSFFNGVEINAELSFWIINKWGGIGSFKNKQSNLLRIEKFKVALGKRKLTKDLFSVISSLSKIASFMNHEEYFVYDSRVIYTLNWLLLKSDINESRFFPMPVSRMQDLTDYDLNTIINLFYNEKNKINKTTTKPLFFDVEYAYFIYCDLIKLLNRQLFSNHKPYYLEMLLFTIAKKEIF